MKKCYFLLLFLTILFLTLGKNVNAYTETGHDDFRKIVFVDENCKLLNSYSSKQINGFYNDLLKVRFGWTTYYINIEEEATYEGITIFSRSNLSSDPIKFDYYFKETTVTTRSVTVTGNVSAKITGSIKKVNISSGLEYTNKKESSVEVSEETKTSFSFVIYPGKKLTMLVTGVCYVTTGVSKYNFLGINFKKGKWEKVDVDTIVYEIREEDA